MEIGKRSLMKLGFEQTRTGKLEFALYSAQISEHIASDLLFGWMRFIHQTSFAY